VYTVPLSAVNGLSRLKLSTSKRAGTADWIRQFSNRPIPFESNRIGRPILIRTESRSFAGPCSVALHRFYRAKRRGARYCRDKLSVRPFLRLSVTLVDCDHMRWNSSKIISRIESLRNCVSGRHQHYGSTPKGTPRNFSTNRSGTGENVDFLTVKPSYL